MWKINKNNLIKFLVKKNDKLEGLLNLLNRFYRHIIDKWYAITEKET